MKGEWQIMNWKVLEGGVYSLIKVLLPHFPEGKKRKTITDRLGHAVCRLRFQLYTKYIYLDRCGRTTGSVGNELVAGNAGFPVLVGRQQKRRKPLGLILTLFSSHAHFRERKFSEYVPCEFTWSWWLLITMETRL
jgi:hypothetical protein